MDKSFYLDLARSGRRMPIATHLVLHEKPDPEAILIDGPRLAAVMQETAERFGNPLALPIMDLTLEKDILLRTMGVPPEQTESFHFDALPDAAAAAKVTTGTDVLVHPRIKANCDALRLARRGRQGDPGRHEHRPVLTADEADYRSDHANLHGGHRARSRG